MKPGRFFRIYWPVISIISFGIIIEAQLFHQKLLNIVNLVIILLIISQLYILYKKRIKINFVNAPVLFSIIYLEWAISGISFFKGEWVFPMKMLLMALSFLLIPFQFFIWVFYIDWPVSRYIKRNIENIWKYIKKGIERFKSKIEELKTKKNRKRFLNALCTACIILAIAGLIKIKEYYIDQKQLQSSQVYLLPIKVIGIHSMSEGKYVDYEIRDSVPLVLKGDPYDVKYVSFKNVTSNIVKFEKAYLKRPETSNYIKINVSYFYIGLDGSREIGFYLDAKNYFVDKEKLKKIDPKILSMQNMPSINYVMIRLYKGYHKVEKIKLGEVEI